MRPHGTDSPARGASVGALPNSLELERIPSTIKILVLFGHNIKVVVQRRHLVVEDGVGAHGRQGRFHKATAKLERLIVRGHGYVTCDAIEWLSDVGASYLQIGRDGNFVASYAPHSVNDVQLRRAQALAATGDAGLRIARQLIADKLRAQSELLESRGLNAESVRLQMAQARENALSVRNPDELLWAEATGAAVYWNALAETPVRFVKAKLDRVPAHWCVFGSRHSTLTSSPRKAVTPASALLNYVLALLESETRTALLATGLDPEMGMLHSLKRSRNSLALDVMEPVRPAVDQFVLDLLATRVFSPGDFVETREGACRLAPDLARVLANTAPRWATLVRPVVARVAEELRRPGPAPRQKPTTARSRFPGALHRRTPNGSLPDVPIAPLARCEDCGSPMSRARYAKCATCERARQALRVPTLGGAQALARMRAAGADPAHGGTAGRKRSAIARSRHAEAMAATGRERITAEERQRFRREVLPRLAGVSVTVLRDATSLSRKYCLQIRGGLRVPHPRHWEALVATGSVGGSDGIIEVRAR